MDFFPPKEDVVRLILESPFLEKEDWKFIEHVAKKLLLSGRTGYVTWRVDQFFLAVSDSIITAIEQEVENSTSVDQINKLKIRTRIQTEWNFRPN